MNVEIAAVGVAMRLDANERRWLSRRLGARLSPYLRSKMKRIPMALIVTVSFWFSSDALADIISKPDNIIMTNTAPALDMDDEKSEKTYTKEELAEKPPEAIPGLQDEMRRQVGNVLKVMTSHQNAANPALLNLYNSNPLPSQTVANLRKGLLLDETHDQNNLADGIQNHLQNDAGKAFTTHITNNLHTWKELQKGFNFNLDFTKIFSGSGSNNSQPVKTAGKMRYGLIVKDIIPDDDAPLQAATSSMTPEDVMRYAGAADVIWTIGPITEDGSERIGSVSMPTLEQLHQRPTSTEANWSDRIPKPVFSGKIQPAFATPPVDAAATGGTPAKPGVALTLSQVQGYYEISKTTTNGLNNGSLEQQFNVPVAGTMKIGRRYNDKMKVIRTQASAVLVDQRLPTVNITYHNMEDRYEATGVYVRGNNRVDVAASTPNGWQPSDFGKTPGELYQVTYTKIF